MHGRQAPTTIGTIARPVDPGAARRRDVHEPNFGRLASDASWRNSWVAILPGRFTSSLHSGLLFVEHSTAYAELYETDGQGRLRTPLLRSFDPLGERTTWSHVVPGLFGPSGFTGLLLYDRAAGVGRFYDGTGHGDFTALRQYSGWRTTWTHIVAGRFVASSPYCSVFFYSASENYGEIWETDGGGLKGTAPYQTLPDLFERPYTHVLGGDFHWTPGYIDSVPTLTDLFFYDANSGHGDMYRCGIDDAGHSAIVLEKAASSDDLPRHAASVVAGNFGGLGNTDVAFYDGSNGTLFVYAFQDLDDTSATIVLRETQPGLRRGATSVAVAGNFWMANTDDHWFNDGPNVTSSPKFDPQWRFGTGTFSDLLFYDRAAGLGEFYFHEPLPPPAEPIEGYVTSRSVHPDAQPRSTGSVLPGETIAFHVSSQHGPYSITIYRQGLFAGGEIEERMTTIEGLPANPQPLPIARNAYREGAQWPAAASLVVPSWPSGLYVARVTTVGTPSFTTDLPFVVRAPLPSQTGVLLVMADPTWYAYDDWGGRNAYGHLTGAEFAGAFPSTSALRIPFGFQLSFERPLHGGFGNSPQAWEIPFVRWLAARGIDVDVCTSRDLHFDPPGADEYRLLIFVGHHEYWSAPMRDHVEAFVRAGGNVVFFTGNTCWWQIRISDDGTQLSCYKVAGFDPLSNTASHALTTVHWFDDVVKRPETTLTGVSWLGDNALFYDQDHRFTVRRADHWVFAGTGLRNEDTFGGYSSVARGEEDRSVCGPETDRVQENGPNGMKSPAGYTLASIYDLANKHFEVGTMGIFRPGSDSGQVFNAPTLNWALGLHRDERDATAVDRITLNVLAKLGHAWTSVSEGRTRAGAPVTAVTTASDRAALLLADPAGGVYATSGNTDAGWGPWQSVSEGSTTPGAPIASVVVAPNRSAVFLADPSGGVFTTSGNPVDGWEPWSTVSEGSCTSGGHLSAVLVSPNRVALFLADPGGGVFTTSGNSHDGWRPWTSVSEGSTTPGAPIGAVAVGGGRIALFLADPAGGIYATSGNAESGWRPWRRIASGTTTPGGTVTAVRSAHNRALLIVADRRGSVMANSVDL